LIINDESSVAAELERVGKACGFTTTSTATVEAFKKSYIVLQPTIVILDLAVPQADGMEMFRWLQSVGCTATVLIISRFGGRVSEAATLLGEARGLKMGAIITEPLRVEDVRGLLTRLSKRS
jgi:DNA-binding response OmpR family regulator